jgi:uncharacterized membrane protein YozB (DUF420 family)
MNLSLETPGFLGTGATLLADITLVAYVFLILPAMIGGYITARSGHHRPQHKWLMIGVTLANWLLIIFLMWASLVGDVLPNLPANAAQPRYFLPGIHALLGAPAQLLATFIVFQMLREDTQVARARRRGETDLQKYWFKNAKWIMRLTLFLWTLTALLGIVSYLIRYEVIGGGGAVPPPAATEEVQQPVSTEELIAPAATEEASQG